MMIVVRRWLAHFLVLLLLLSTWTLCDYQHATKARSHAFGQSATDCPLPTDSTFIQYVN